MFANWLPSKQRRSVARLVQYVGDETILLYGQDEVFVYVDGRDASLTPCLLRDDAWEPALADFLERNLRPGQCFVDIGANNGIHSLRAARQVGPTGLVVAFEPQERLLKLLQRSVAANVMLDTVQARRVAIGSAAGIAHLGKFPNLTGSATFTENEYITEHEEVPIAPLDAALAEIAQAVSRPVEPDIIKVDVEGFEYHVWNGMKAWTRSREHLQILLEFSPVSYRNLGQDPMALLMEFGEFGFAIRELQAEGRTRMCSAADLGRMADSRQQFDLVLSK